MKNAQLSAFAKHISLQTLRYTQGPDDGPCYIDSNGNHIHVSVIPYIRVDGLRVLLCHISPSVGYSGYLAIEEPDGGFGNPSCPSSYHRPCIAWYGRKERYRRPEHIVAMLLGGGHATINSNDIGDIAQKKGGIRKNLTPP